MSWRCGSPRSSPDKDVVDAKQQEMRLVYGYYIKGHNLKIQTDIGEIKYGQELLDAVGLGPAQRQPGSGASEAPRRTARHRAQGQASAYSADRACSDPQQGECDDTEDDPRARSPSAALLGSLPASAQAVEVDKSIRAYAPAGKVSGNLTAIGSDTLNNLDDPLVGVVQEAVSEASRSRSRGRDRRPRRRR